MSMPEPNIELFANYEQRFEEARANWTTVYPIFIRMKQPLKYQDLDIPVVNESLAYIASTEELAEAWCKKNTDYNLRDVKDMHWWFAITQEAIDGEYSGIKGLIKLLDWDANEIELDPVQGYQAESNESE